MLRFRAKPVHVCVSADCRAALLARQPAISLILSWIVHSTIEHGHGILAGMAYAPYTARASAYSKGRLG